MNAIERFKQWGQKLFSPQHSPSTTVLPKQNNINIEVLKKNMIDQTPYTNMAIGAINRMPVKQSVGNYGGINTGSQIKINPNDGGNKIGVLRHEMGHMFDQNIGGGTPATFGSTSDSFGLLKNIKTSNPGIFKQFENNLTSWGGYYEAPASMTNTMDPTPGGINQGMYRPNWRDVESYAMMNENPQSALTQVRSIASRFPQFVPYNKNINYSPVYPSPELLQTSKK